MSNESETEQVRFVPQLDEMLTAEEAAPWLKTTVRNLHEKSKGHRAQIPAFRSGLKGPRYHPRTIITKMALDAGLSLEAVAASFGLRIVQAVRHGDHTGGS